jgi:hypothetical protein
MTVALAAAMQVGQPFSQPVGQPFGQSVGQPSGQFSGQPVGQPSPSEMPNFPAAQNAYNQYGFEGKYEPRYPFDTQQNWVHGYHQEIPAYGGHVFFRPYNYKDILSQSQTAAGWGMSPTMPYSQQYWHRYHDQATMLKLSHTAPATQPTVTPSMPSYPVMPAGAWTGHVMVPSQQIVVPHQPAMTAPVMTSPVIIEQAPLLPGYGYGRPAAATPAPQLVIPTGTVYPAAPR